MQQNLRRMIELADSFFEARHDPEQILVTPRVMAHLRRIHPATLSEKATRSGPIAWMLLVPTTEILMRKFIEGTISEKELLKRTPLHRSYQAIYLCSALVLLEYRGRGIAKRLLARSIRAICRDHPIAYLFCWPFSRRGGQLARSVAKKARLPLLFK